VSELFDDIHGCDNLISLSNGWILIKFARNLELSRKGNPYLTAEQFNTFDLAGRLSNEFS
jgi:hypothetical protein